MDKKSHTKVIFGVILSIIVIIGLWSVLYIHYSSPTRLAMEYIYNHTLSSGKFIYKTNVNPGVKYKNDTYSAENHAGVLYSMYLCERIRKDKFLRDKRILSSDYFIQNFIMKSIDNMYVVSENGDTAELGATGLALAALSNLYSGKDVSNSILIGLGKFIVFMQRSDGSFFSEYSMSKGIYSDSVVDNYSEEAVLGLLYLYEIDKNKLWVDTARKGLLYLANNYSDSKSESFKPWFLIAAKKLLETPDNGLTAEETIKLRKTAKKLANNIIMKQVTYSKDPFVGSFVLQRDMNVVSTLVEGLNAAYYVVDSKYTKNEIKKAVKLSIKFLDKYQVKEGKLIGGIPGNPNWKKSLNKLQGEIRIDNVQHALCAWLTSKGVR